MNNNKVWKLCRWIWWLNWIWIRLSDCSDESCDSGNSGDYHWWSGESDDSDATYESDNPWEYSDSGELIKMANQLNMVILMELQTIFIMGEFGESRDSGDSDESGKSSKCGYSGDSCESDDSGEWDHSGKVV